MEAQVTGAREEFTSLHYAMQKIIGKIDLPIDIPAPEAVGDDSDVGYGDPDQAAGSTCQPVGC